jgi:hypothetical protein
VFAESSDDEQIIERVAALDIGKAEIVCCIRLPAADGGRRVQEVSTHSTMVALNRPEFHAPSVMCERPVGRHWLSHSSWLRSLWAGSGRGGASVDVSCTRSPSPR